MGSANNTTDTHATRKDSFINSLRGTLTRTFRHPAPRTFSNASSKKTSPNYDTNFYHLPTTKSLARPNHRTKSFSPNPEPNPFAISRIKTSRQLPLSASNPIRYRFLNPLCRKTSKCLHLQTCPQHHSFSPRIAPVRRLLSPEDAPHEHSSGSLQAPLPHHHKKSTQTPRRSLHRSLPRPRRRRLHHDPHARPLLLRPAPRAHRITAADRKRNKAPRRNTRL